MKSNTTDFPVYNVSKMEIRDTTQMQIPDTSNATDSFSEFVINGLLLFCSSTVFGTLPINNPH